MTPETPSRQDTARERHVAKHAAPVVVFIGEGFSRVASSRDSDELWQRYGNALRALIAVHEPALRTGDSVSTILPDGSCTVHIVPLLGNPGFALVLEPLERAAPVTDQYERFALTRREREVARLLVAGANTAEIASALTIAPSTAVIHVKSILAKTGVKTRAAAVGRIVHHDGGERQRQR